MIRMSSKDFLAFDFGATSGRAILGQVDTTIRLQEMHRFTNPHTELNGRFYWDILHLYRSMIEGMQKTVQAGFANLSGIAIDTWGVDFGLLDRQGRLVSNPVMYRDPRTSGMLEKTFSKLSRETIYGETGIQFMELNTLFQWVSLIEEKSPLLDAVETLLFTPDLLAYFLTGEKAWEYSIASTSQLMHAKSGSWSDIIFTQLGLNQNWVGQISKPGSILGPLQPSVQTETGLKPVDVLLTASHDTASAVAAVPAHGEDWAYLSSGTWSLIGIESHEPIITDLSEKYNYTNEGGAGDRIRFLKNVAGMWLLEECRRAWAKAGETVLYEDLIAKALAAPAFACFINPDHPMFVLPDDMPNAIRTFCQKTGQPIPETQGAIVRCIFESLAMKYAQVLFQIREMTNREINRLHIIGGGSKNGLLNQWAANAIGIPVIAGPVEATAIGNIMMQAIGKGILNSLEEGRQLVLKSFEPVIFEPDSHEKWQDHFQQFLNYVKVEV